jgi:AcrR family transcriptional regulator
MQDEDSAPNEPRAPGRGPKVRAAVLTATLAELAAVGYAALTVEDVARRAGVHKTTIYRRWQDRERLILDALTDHVAAEVPMPDTGSIEEDLRQLARALVRWLQSTPGQAVLATMVSGAWQQPEIAEIRRRFYVDRFQRAEPVIARAIARGELPEGTNPAALIKAMIAPIYLCLLVTAEPIDEETADQAAAMALVAARAGVLGSREVGKVRRLDG